MSEHPENCPQQGEPGPRPPFKLDKRLFVLLAVLIVLLTLSAIPSDVWTVTDIVKPEGVSLGGVEAAIGMELAAGSMLLDDGSELELQLGRRLRIRVAGPAELELPGGPGRLFGRRRNLMMRRGRLWGHTGGEPLGFDLYLETHCADALLRAGAFMVSCYASSCRFALAEGSMDLTHAGGTVSARDLVGRVTYFGPDGQGGITMSIGDMEPEDREALGRLIRKGLPELD